MSNWSDKIVVIGVGVSKEDTDKIKEIILEKVNNDELQERETLKTLKTANKVLVEMFGEGNN